MPHGNHRKCISSRRRCEPRERSMAMNRLRWSPMCNGRRRSSRRRSSYTQHRKPLHSSVDRLTSHLCDEHGWSSTLSSYHWRSFSIDSHPDYACKWSRCSRYQYRIGHTSLAQGLTSDAPSHPEMRPMRVIGASGFHSYGKIDWSHSIHDNEDVGIRQLLEAIVDAHWKRRSSFRRRREKRGTHRETWRPVIRNRRRNLTMLSVDVHWHWQWLEYYSSHRMDLTERRIDRSMEQSLERTKINWILCEIIRRCLLLFLLPLAHKNKLATPIAKPTVTRANENSVSNWACVNFDFT